MEDPRSHPPSRSTDGLFVSIVTETFPPEVNGVAMTTGRLVDGLRRRGHKIGIIRPARADEEPLETNPDAGDWLVRGLPLPRYPQLRFGVPATRALKRFWSANRPDLVHVVTEGPLGWSAVAAARELKLPVTSDFHTHFEQYSEHYGIGWLKRPVAAYLKRLHERTDVTFVPTRTLAHELGLLGYCRLKVIGRGVDTRLFQPERRCADLRHSWGLAAAQLAVVYVGRIAAEKNLPLVLRAFEAIAQVRPDARLIFVGDGPELPLLKQSHPRHLYAGMRVGVDLARHYASADMFLFPSLTETFGNVTLEALASGLAVVSYDRAAASELIRHGQNGMAVGCGDEAAFVRSAVSVAEDARLLNALRTQARLTALSHDWERVIDEFSDALRDNLAAQRRISHFKTLFFSAL